MGLQFRRRVKGPLGTLLTLSFGGVTVTKTFGKRLTVNTHGDVWLRLFRGMTWKIL